MPQKELQPRREPEPDKPYVRTALYGADGPALQAYTHAQGIVFNADCDLSAYRIRYENLPHVVILGAKPPADVDEKIRQALATGIPAELPPEIIATLIQRRGQAKGLGPWVEGHYRPGKAV